MGEGVERVSRYQGDVVGLPPPGSELHITGNLQVRQRRQRRQRPPKMNGKDTNRNPKKVETCKNLALIVKHCFSIFFFGLPWSNGRSGMPQADLTSWVHQWPWEMPIESWTDEIHMDQEELRRDPKSKDLGHEILVMSTNQEWWQCQNWKKISWWGWWLQESTGTCS